MKTKILISLFIVLFLFQNCKVLDDIPDLNANVEIINFTADPQSIQIGNKSTLSWETKNAGDVSISNIGTVTLSGSIDVFPLFTTEYTMTAKNDKFIQQQTITVTVSISPPPPPSERAEIIKYKSDKYEVPVYEKAMLSWETANAQSVFIDELGYVDFSGSGLVNPQKTTIYSITAKGSDNVKVSDKLTIEVDTVSSCSGLGVYEYQGYSGGVNVTVGKNKSKYYSAQNVKVQVKLFDMYGNLMEQGTGIIPVIPPLGYGDVDIPLSKWGSHTKSEIIVTDCDCNFTE